MYERRLLKLADWLDAQAVKPDFDFDLDRFGMLEHGKSELTCGTVACALGGAALSGLFKNEGLSFTSSGIFVSVRYTSRSGKVYFRYEAGAKLSGISYDAAQHLFYPGLNYTRHRQKLTGPRGARNVAKMIRKFVASGGVI